MIKSIVLKNFRGFRDHTIDFTPFCLLIGQNNAGKTTLIEALRIAATAIEKVRSAKIVNAPTHFAPDITGPGFKFSLDTLDIENRGIHYNYESSEPAMIRVRYSNNCAIVIAIGEELSDNFCQFLLPGGKKIHLKNQMSGKFHPIYVMPPIGSLLGEESQRDRRYLYKHINGYLSYRHIRNQMKDMPAEFSNFRESLIETWSSKLQVSDIEFAIGDGKSFYTLTIRDGPFVSEVALVGSGLQAWIQTIWFLSRVNNNAIVVLDEPDVYLHADLQRKLTKILSVERYRQTIVATHSMEMIADVSPGEIVSVNKRSQRSRALSSSAQAQSVVDAIGTNLNIQLSKLAEAGTIIFLEGKDYGYLDQIAFKKGYQFYDKFSKIPHFPVGGMNNWPRAALAARAFHSTSSGKVRGILFLDHDYKPDSVFDQIAEDAAKDSLAIKVWTRKEIENFFLDPKLIFSYIENRARHPVNEDAVRIVFDEVIHNQIKELPELIAHGYQMGERGLALPTVMKRSKEFIAKKRGEGVSWNDLICGKKAISAISARSQEEWGVQISPMSLCRHMTIEDVPIELSIAVDNILLA